MKILLLKVQAHSILERNSFSIAISLLTVDIISQKPHFFHILRLLFTFISKKQKNKSTKSTYIL